MSKKIHQRNDGFTLAGLLVSIAIVGILLAIGIPSFQATSLNSTLSSYTNQLIASAQTARSEAMKRNSVVRICPSTNGTSCTTGNWNQGWIVYVLSTTEVLYRQQELNTNYIIKSTDDRIDFEPSGIGVSQANLTLCKATPYAGSNERILTVSATGRILLSRTETGVCSI